MELRAKTALSWAIGHTRKAKMNQPKAKSEIVAKCYVDNTIAQPKRRLGLSA
jgi:hypothetical protein